MISVVGHELRAHTRPSWRWGLEILPQYIMDTFPVTWQYQLDGVYKKVYVGFYGWSFTSSTLTYLRDH